MDRFAEHLGFPVGDGVDLVSAYACRFRSRCRALPAGFGAGMVRQVTSDEVSALVTGEGLEVIFAELGPVGELARSATGPAAPPAQHLDMLVIRREGARPAEQHHLCPAAIEHVQLGKFVAEIRPGHCVLHLVEAIEDDQQAAFLVQVDEALIAVAVNDVFAGEHGTEQRIEARRPGDIAELYQNGSAGGGIGARPLRLMRHDALGEAGLAGAITAENGEWRRVLLFQPSLEPLEEELGFPDQRAALGIVIVSGANTGRNVIVAEPIVIERIDLGADILGEPEDTILELPDSQVTALRVIGEQACRVGR